MNESIIAVRYAKALFALGFEKKTLEHLEKDILMVAQSVSDVYELSQLLHSPVVRASVKTKAINLIFASHIGEDTLRFIDLLIAHRRETLLPDVARSFLRMAREHRGIKLASFTTAVVLPAPLSDRIKEAVEDMYHSVIELELKQDPSLIGGYILRVGDDRYDASVASGLRKMKQLLTERNKEL